MKAQDYSGRRFTNDADSSWAFTGVLKYIQKDFPKGWFKGEKRRCGEFIVLSTRCTMERDELCLNRGDDKIFHQFLIDHVPDCKRAQENNVMLVGWEGKIAYRVNITKIGKDVWKESNSQRKHIVLG
ncbi:hypothetical protein AOQ84DRAFT_378137 [Glonium stellatum]|uniref:Uncharacterized protein n=1 Tax=Glonium stellatum TaxID=574774 RepID=A0A8E2EY10_9PEZI|nr:hypothetical protein AOQ84DRAFT_378137 [Glonium stellatum]